MFNNYPMVLQQTLAGQGVCLGWRPLVDDLLSGGGLVVVGPEVVSPRGYYLTWREGSPNRKVQSIIDWLETELV